MNNNKMIIRTIDLWTEAYKNHLVREISWSNNIAIMEKCKDNLEKEFYIQMTKRYGWTKRFVY